MPSTGAFYIQNTIKAEAAYPRIDFHLTFKVKTVSFYFKYRHKMTNATIKYNIASILFIRIMSRKDSLFKKILYSETKVDVKEIIKRLDFVNKILEQL
jgi:hypothetical protein